MLPFTPKANELQLAWKEPSLLSKREAIWYTSGTNLALGVLANPNQGVQYAVIKVPVSTYNVLL
jgi:hypothetical protein